LSDFVLAVRVTPRSSRNAVRPGRGGELAVRVTAAPVDGAANAAVVALVAQAFRVPKRAVQVIGGETARDKRLSIAGDPAELARIAQALVQPAPR